VNEAKIISVFIARHILAGLGFEVTGI